MRTESSKSLQHQKYVQAKNKQAERDATFGLIVQPHVARNPLGSRTVLGLGWFALLVLELESRDVVAG